MVKKEVSKDRSVAVAEMLARREWERQSTKRTGLMFFSVMVVAIILAFAFVVSQPMSVEGHCVVSDWSEFPDGVALGELVMFPDVADCEFRVSGPVYLLGVD